MSPLLGTIEEAIFWVQLLSLSLNKDSLIRRKCGEDAAERVRKWVTGLINEADQSKKYDGLRDLDHWLRHDNHARNPGTTADLLAAALFVSLRNRTIDPKMPFTWPAHPFEIGA
jgi:triphosphoribosyl-dephospho-CoA synthase